MAEKAKKRPDLSRAEWEIMKVVWDGGALAARDICAGLPKDQQRANATVRTLLRRMVNKGWLTYQQIGNSYLYRPKVTENVAVAAAVKDFTKRVLRNNISTFIDQYAGTKKLGADDVKKLKAIIKNAK